MLLDHEFARQPVSQSVRLIDFERAEVRPGFLPGTYILVVSGVKPYLNMQVTLSPLVYVRQPEYWGIEVIGSLPGIGLPTRAPYTVALPLDSIRGSVGIEVTRSEGYCEGVFHGAPDSFSNSSGGPRSEFPSEPNRSSLRCEY